jgi:hypothetical protein
MIVTCARVIFPPLIEEDDVVVREAKVKAAARYARKRRVVFHLSDVEKFCQHEDSPPAAGLLTVFFYASDPIVVEYDFEEFERLFREYNSPPDDDEEETFRFYIPAN